MSSTNRVNKFRENLQLEENLEDFHLNETIRRDYQRKQYAVAEKENLREKWKNDKQQQRQRKKNQLQNDDENMIENELPKTNSDGSTFNTKSALYKAMSKVESALPKDQGKAEEVLRGVLKRRNVEENEPKIPKKIIKRGYEKLSSTIVEFFECDEISKQLPGMKDCVSSNGEKAQKRIMMMSMEQALGVFKEMFPEQNCSYSKLCKERPKHVIKFMEIKHETCICNYCENEDLRFAGLKKFIINSKMTLDTMLPHLVCSTSSYDCMSSSCSLCSNFMERLQELLLIPNGALDQKVKFSQWIHSDGFLQLTKNTEKTLQNLLDDIEGTFKHYKLHRFTIQAQYKFLKSLKNDVSDQKAILFMDYSQNYECRTQREASTAYFGRRQVGLFTAAALIGNTLEQISFAIVNDDLSHDSKQV